MSTFLAFFKDRDAHGTPVVLNFKGEETHKTWLGACLTIVINLIVFTYAVLKTNNMFQKNDPEAIQFAVQKHLDDRGNYNLPEHRYNLAFSIFDIEATSDTLAHINDIPKEIANFKIERVSLAH